MIQVSFDELEQLIDYIVVDWESGRILDRKTNDRVGNIWTCRVECLDNNGSGRNSVKSFADIYIDNVAYEKYKLQKKGG